MLLCPCLPDYTCQRCTQYSDLYAPEVSRGKSFGTLIKPELARNPGPDISRRGDTFKFVRFILRSGHSQILLYWPGPWESTDWDSRRALHWGRPHLSPSQIDQHAPLFKLTCTSSSASTPTSRASWICTARSIWAFVHSNRDQPQADPQWATTHLKIVGPKLSFSCAVLDSESSKRGARLFL
jgi:hypothetical protein